MGGKTCPAELKGAMPSRISRSLSIVPPTIKGTKGETDKLGSAYYPVKPRSFKGLFDGVKGTIDAAGNGKGA
jgi:hypothetical protein